MNSATAETIQLQSTIAYTQLNSRGDSDDWEGFGDEGNDESTGLLTSMRTVIVNRVSWPHFPSSHSIQSRSCQIDNQSHLFVSESGLCEAYCELQNPLRLSQI